MKYGLIDKGDRILVAVSGGPDSVALLYMLAALKNGFRLKLHIAHLNHMIRKKGARADAEFVKNLAKRLKLSSTIATVDVPAMAKRDRLSLEDAGREARYEFFINTARRLKLNKIATAHTKDDQAETALMRILKGTGLAGLSGISPVWKAGELSVIRPFLDVSKEDVIRFLKSKNILYREDPTNKSNIYFRNRIRNELLPLLRRRFNPNVIDGLSALSDTARQDYDYIAREARKLYLECRRSGRAAEIKLALKKFLRCHPAMQAGMTRIAINELKGDLETITYRHWEAVQKLMRGRAGTKILNLPSGINIAREYGALVFYKAAAKKPIAEFLLDVPGVTEVAALGIRADAKLIERQGAIKRGKNRFEEAFDYEKLSPPLIIRLRMPGDRIKPLGMKGTKKVKNLLIDEKMPLRERDKTPVILSGGQIIWVVGVRMSEDFKVDKTTRQVLRLNVKDLT